MKVEILNPDVLEDLYSNHGTFACTCYDTPVSMAKKVGKSCMKNGHMSGSRCEYIKFRIDDVDRGTAEQCLRHEIGVSVDYICSDNYSFSDYMEKVLDVSPDQIIKNMASFRYIDKDGFTYTTPDEIEKIGTLKDIYDYHMQTTNYTRNLIKESLMNEGVDEKRANECANFVLPRATNSSLTIGFTPEALIQFMHKRLCKRAQPEIRKLAVLMKARVHEINPDFAKELVPQCEHLLWCPEGKMSCGMRPTKEEIKEKLKG